MDSSAVKDKRIDWAGDPPRIYRTFYSLGVLSIFSIVMIALFSTQMYDALLTTVFGIMILLWVAAFGFVLILVALVSLIVLRKIVGRLIIIAAFIHIGLMCISFSGWAPIGKGIMIIFLFIMSIISFYEANDTYRSRRYLFFLCLDVELKEADILNSISHTLKTLPIGFKRKDYKQCDIFQIIKNGVVISEIQLWPSLYYKGIGRNEMKYFITAQMSNPIHKEIRDEIRNCFINALIERSN